MFKRLIVFIAMLSSTYGYEVSGKLKLTSGVSQVEGSAGGGLTPWAVIGSYATRDQVGANAFHTSARLTDYNLETTGLSIGLFNFVELTYAKQSFDTENVGAALGIGKGFKLEQEIFGIKARVYGDVLLEQDSFIPQVAVGLQYKNNKHEAIVKSLGSTDNEGVDYYISATKIHLKYSYLYNLTLRNTKANQLGILGFGGNKNNSSQFYAEASLGYILTPTLVIGAEYRMKPDNLNVAVEDDWKDIFIAWTPTKNISLTGAYLMLGNIALKDDQTGIYSSLQVGF